MPYFTDHLRTTDEVMGRVAKAMLALDTADDGGLGALEPEFLEHLRRQLVGLWLVYGEQSATPDEAGLDMTMPICANQEMRAAVLTVLNACGEPVANLPVGLQ